ncbi:MAG TPA: hypothetical protein DIW81_19070 [Planctomycetaceae bacterium]|nr:hypothetical protein [Planctomycetaceae bacterium]
MNIRREACPDSGAKSLRNDFGFSVTDLLGWHFQSEKSTNISRDDQLSCMLIDTEKEHGDPPVRATLNRYQRAASSWPR